MSGTRDGGIKAAKKVRELYGEEAVKAWGSKGARSRKTNSGGLCDPVKAKEISAKGGEAGHRSRSFSLDSKFRPDEWGLLIRAIYDVANRIGTYDEKMGEAEQYLILQRLFECWMKRDWISAFTETSDHPDFIPQLENELKSKCKYYLEITKDQPRHSDDREIFRVYRNLMTAFNFAIGKS